MENNDIFFEMDACVTDTTEWEMWDVVRSVYEPESIPRKIQLQCFQRLSALQRPLIFSSFHFHGMIHSFISKHEGWFGNEFVFGDHIERPHTDLVIRMLTNHPLCMTMNFTETSIVFCGYDRLGERFVVLGGDMDYIRGFHDTMEQYLTQQLPYLFMESVSLHLA